MKANKSDNDKELTISCRDNYANRHLNGCQGRAFVCLSTCYVASELLVVMGDDDVNMCVCVFVPDSEKTEFSEEFRDITY